ncbi:MAG: chemotaxis protein CheW [Spirochaetes bacterium]|nr:chemotaxis protein CheW [Spirochaetota bacterium]
MDVNENIFKGLEPIDNLTKEKNPQSKEEGEREGENYLEAEIQLVVFTVKEVEYAININSIFQIIKYTEISPLPHAPMFIKGVINLRGKVIPVVDLRERFHSEAIVNTKRTRIILASIQDKEIGLIVDSVTDVIGIAGKQVEPPLPVISGLQIEFIEGIAKLKNKLIIIINIHRILSSSEKIVLKEAPNE